MMRLRNLSEQNDTKLDRCNYSYYIPNEMKDTGFKIECKIAKRGSSGRLAVQTVSFHGGTVLIRHPMMSLQQ